MALAMINEFEPAQPIPVLVPSQHSNFNPIEVLNLKENEFVFKEGDPAQGLYLLKSGAVKLVTNRSLLRGRMSSPEYVTRIVGPGDFFGFKAILKGINYDYFAKTLRPSEIHVYSKDSLVQVMNGPTSLLKMVLNQIAKDMEQQDKIAQLHYLASVQERIAYQLVLLANKFGMQTDQGMVLNLKLTRNELAQLAGTINESLSRHLTEFKNEGILELNGREIIVKDLQALMKKSGNFKF